MALTRIDDDCTLTLVREGGLWVTADYRWSEEVSDSSGNSRKEGRFGEFKFADLPPGAATSLDAVLGHILTHRDSLHPLV